MSKKQTGAKVLAAPAGGGEKLKTLRRARRKSYYAAQFARTTANQKRRMKRHVRANPADGRARAIYDRKFGNVDSLELTARGKRRERSHG